MATRIAQSVRLCGVLMVILIAATVAEPQKSATNGGSGAAVPPGYSATVTGGIHDFDFYFGAWTVCSRGLKARNVGSNDWRDFSSIICVTPYLNGGVNGSEVYSPALGSSGLTVRTFDLQKQQWSVPLRQQQDWPNGSGTFGGFNGVRGTFFGEDIDNGQPIKVRITWTDLDHDHVRWEQAFSYDNHTWETNWISE